MPAVAARAVASGSYNPKRTQLEAAQAILDQPLVTPQTGPDGQVVRKLLIEEGIRIESEIYAGLVVDRTRQRVVLMVSPEGGMEIEEVAEATPEKIFKSHVDPEIGLTAPEAAAAARVCRHT